MNWISHIDRLQQCLGHMVVQDIAQQSIDNNTAFKKWRTMTIDIREKQSVVYLIGNGASASMASHFAADLAKNASLHTQVFTDIALITAVANDFSYQDVFVQPLRSRLKPGDMLVAISSSGNSANVINACEFAVNNDAHVVTLSAMQPDNSLRSKGELNFWIPAETYGIAETSHAAILHYWMDSVSKLTD